MARQSDNGGALVVGALGITAFALLAFSKKGAVLKNLQLGIDSVAGKRSGANLELSFNISAYNPNTQAVQYNRFVGNAYYGGEIVANFDANTPALIQPRTTTKIPLKATIPLLKVAKNILDAINMALEGKKMDVNLNIRGILYAENLKIPVEKNIELTLTT